MQTSLIKHLKEQTPAWPQVIWLTVKRFEQSHLIKIPKESNWYHRKGGKFIPVLAIKLKPQNNKSYHFSCDGVYQ